MDLPCKTAIRPLDITLIIADNIKKGSTLR